MFEAGFQNPLLSQAWRFSYFVQGGEDSRPAALLMLGLISPVS